MKLELSIKDDKELRDLIKDMIRGQVSSIVRSDLERIVEEATGRKITGYVENIAKATIAPIVERLLRQIQTDIDRQIRSEVKSLVEQRARVVLNQG